MRQWVITGAGIPEICQKPTLTTASDAVTLPTQVSVAAPAPTAVKSVTWQKDVTDVPVSVYVIVSSPSDSL